MGIVKDKQKDLEIVFCFQNCSNLLGEKVVPEIEEKLLKFEAEGRQFAMFEITGTIYSIS